MDLEAVGRHALQFDDDVMAGFVNSGDALVEWHSLQIDRYDVRHLLSGPPPPRRRNFNHERLLLDDLSLEAQLDHERYLDLPTHSDQPEPDVEEDEHRSDTSGFRAVAFSYRNSDDYADQKNTDAGMGSSGFLPHFPIPEELLHCLPPTEKVHQIIARTAAFVSKHGGQSEIILRVKQGDNPTFGFLMPGQDLHAYFRYLVDHPELLHSESEGNSHDQLKMTGSENNKVNGVGGALSLLGSVYGSGDEEEDDAENTEIDTAEEQVSSGNHSLSHGSKKVESRSDAAKDEAVSRNPISNKQKVLTVKKNNSITATKPGTGKGMEEKSRLVSTAADKAKSLTMGTTSKIDPLILEPPPELKRLIDKIVEFVMRNGKQFEATVIEQDSKHGRFPFLLPSNQYHSYYLKVLQMAQESKNGRSFSSGKDDLVGQRMEKKPSLLKEKDFSSSASAVCDMPFESDRKEKFKMVIGKSKKETQETDDGDTLDAASAAAILQAATRGIKSSNSQLISSTSPDAHVHVNAVDESRNSGSRNGDVSAVGPKRTASTVSPEAEAPASEGDSSTKVQKLRAERLKRAKMFVAMLKSGEVPFRSVESGALRSNCDGKDVDHPATSETKPERNYFNEEHNDGHSKRNFRSRSRRHEEGSENESASGSSEDDKYKDEKNHRRSRKKHRSHHSSREHSRKRLSSKNLSEDDEREISKKKHRSHRSRDKHRHRRRHSSRERESHKEHENHNRRDNHKKELYDELEEGEIGLKVSRGIASGHVSREASVDVASFQRRASPQPSDEVPDDLRAKIRAMLMATRL